MPELGRVALVVCLGLGLYALIAGTFAAYTRRRRLALSAQNAIVASFGATAVASGVLLSALLRNDFSFVYVASSTSIELPTGYTISAFWSSQEGSLLLWLLVLTGFSAVAVLLNRRFGRELLTWAVPVLALVIVFFSFMLVAPPLFYLGFVGLRVPFASARGPPRARRSDEAWIVSTRRWTLTAWTF